MNVGVEGNLALLAPYLSALERVALRDHVADAQRNHPERMAPLIQLACSSALDHRWEEIKRREGAALLEEVERVAALLREALAEPPEDGLWASLFLACAVRGLAAARVWRRSHPVPPAPTPSAFVYAMR